MKKYIFLSLSLIMLSACSNKKKDEVISKSTNSTVATSSSSVTTETKTKESKEEITINSLSEDSIRKRVIILLLKQPDNFDKADLGEISYMYEADIEKNDDNYTGGVSSNRRSSIYGAPLAVVTINKDGTTTYQNSGFSTEVQNSIVGNILSDVSQEEEDLITHDVSRISYKSITHNSNLFKNFTQSIFDKYGLEGIGSPMKVTDVGDMDILSELARKEGNDFILGIQTNSNVIYATSDTEIYMGSPDLSMPENGNPSANWKLDEQMTAELWALYDNVKIEEESTNVLSTCLAHLGNYEQDTNKWKLIDNPLYDYEFVYEGTQQAIAIKNRAAYTSQVVKTKGRMYVINYGLTKELMDRY